MQMFNLIVNGKTVNNQYILLDGCKQTFRSYQTDIATYSAAENKITVSDNWDISAATLKYFCRWIEQISGCEKANKSTIEKAFKAGNINSIEFVKLN